MRIVAFDVDGCLINERDEPRLDVLQLLLGFRVCGYEVWVWSGGGLDYAARWVERLGLSPYVSHVMAKDKQVRVDVAVDDMPDADLGIVTVVV